LGGGVIQVTSFPFSFPSLLWLTAWICYRLQAVSSPVNWPAERTSCDFRSSLKLFHSLRLNLSLAITWARGRSPRISRVGYQVIDMAYAR
jgi:hypothetical protein